MAEPERTQVDTTPGDREAGAGGTTKERKGHADGNGMNRLDNLRRIQQSGRSSLTISLPKWWVRMLHAKVGDVVMLQPTDQNRLELTLTSHGASSSRPQKTLTVEADDAAPSIITRLITGAYVTGQDQIIIRSRQKLSAEILEEISRASSRLLGVGIVAETPLQITLQVFADPSRYRYSSLMERVTSMLRTEVDSCRKALEEQKAPHLSKIDGIEEEIDRVLFLMVRQILLASEDFKIAADVGVSSHHIQIGCRLVAKCLEVIGDRLHDIGLIIEATLNDQENGGFPSPVTANLIEELRAFDDALFRTAVALKNVSPEIANANLSSLESRIRTLMGKDYSNRRRYGPASVGEAAQRIVTNLLAAMEMLVSINEVTINRSTEPEILAREHGGPLVIHTPSYEEKSLGL